MFLLISKNYSLQTKKGCSNTEMYRLKVRQVAKLLSKASSPGSDPAISKNLITKSATFVKEWLKHLLASPKKLKI
jgi:hypothetical protein